MSIRDQLNVLHSSLQKHCCVIIISKYCHLSSACPTNCEVCAEINTCSKCQDGKYFYTDPLHGIYECRGMYMYTIAAITAQVITS